MTKSAYFEMCEALGSEPIDSEIPVDFEDLYIDVQQALGIYHKFRDDWDYMNGVYLGKNFTGLKDILDILEVLPEDRKTMFELLGIIDKHRAKAIADSRPKSTK